MFTTQALKLAGLIGLLTMTSKAAPLEGRQGGPINKHPVVEFTNTWPAYFCCDEGYNIIWTGGSGYYDLDQYFRDPAADFIEVSHLLTDTTRHEYYSWKAPQCGDGGNPEYSFEISDSNAEPNTAGSYQTSPIIPVYEC